MNQTHTITNRNGLSLIIRIDWSDDNAKKLAFVAHGQKGTMDQPHIEAFANAFLQNGYRVVRFDATNSVGQSGGILNDVTYDNYVSDLEDVITWAKTQEWFVSPFALCGHSMGAQSTAWYAEYHPAEVSILLPMAPPINYELYASTFNPAELEHWHSTGYRDTTSSAVPDTTFSIKWNLMESLKRYDILMFAEKLNMPVLNIIGSHDQPCPQEHQQIFMDQVASTNKQLVVIDGLNHSYRSIKTDLVDERLNAIEETMSEWIKGADATKS